MAGPYMKDGGMNRDPKRGQMGTFKRGAEQTIKRERAKSGREDRGNPMTFLPGTRPNEGRAVKQSQFIGQGYTVPETPRRVDLSQRESDTGCVEAAGLTTRAKRKMKQ